MGGGKLNYFSLMKVLILLYNFSKRTYPLFCAGLVIGIRIICEDLYEIKPDQ